MISQHGFFVTMFMKIILLGSVVAGANDQPRDEFMNSSQPFVIIPHMTAPKIDGLLDEQEWRQGVAVSSFSLSDGSRLAKEQTICYTGYDNDNIYFLIHMNEFALDPKSNQREAFKATLKGKQAHIWFDDSAEIRISSPANPLKIYYLGVNANAATYMTTITLNKDGSPKKQDEWMPDIKIKTSINDGYWIAEIAIPFKDLGGRFEANTPCGRLNINRFEQRLGETSSWSSLRGNIHAYAQYGYFSISDRVPAIHFYGIPDISPGENSFTVDLFSPTASKGVMKTVVLNETKSSETFQSFNIKAHELQMVATTFNTSSPNKDWVQVFLYDIEDNLLYRTAQNKYAANTTVTRVSELTWEGKFSGKSNPSIFINGNKISPDDKTKGILKPGLNLLALHIPPDSKITGGFVIGGESVCLDSTWRFTKRIDVDWEKIKYDDSKWKNIDPSSLKQSQDTDLYLRKIILVDASKRYPLFPDDTIYLSHGGAYGFLLMPVDIPHWNPKTTCRGYRIIIDVPKGIDLINVCGKLGRTFRVNPQHWKEADSYSFSLIGEIPRGKDIYNRYIITSMDTFPLSQDTRYVFGNYNACHITIKATEEATLWDNNVLKTIFYKCEAMDGYVQEIDNALNVKILPPLNGMVPKNITISLGGQFSQLDFMADKSALFKLIDTVKSAGFNEIQYSGDADVRGKTGIKTYQFSSIFRGKSATLPPDLIDTAELDNAFPENRQVGQEGKIRKRTCRSFIVSNKDARNLLKKTIARTCSRTSGPSSIFMDWEVPPIKKTPNKSDIKIQDEDSCYCKNCLEDFRNKYKINEPVSVEIIVDKYIEQWIDFQTTLTADWFALVSEGVHECGKELMAYSGYQDAYTREYYGIDWKKIAPHIDRAYSGYGRSIESINATKQALQGKPLCGGVLSVKLSPVISSSAEMLRRIIDCDGGVLCWWEDGYDAKKLAQVAKVSGFVSLYEDFFVKGKNVNDCIMCPLKDAVEVRQMDNKYLVICLNEGTQPLTVPLTFSKAVKHMQDAESLKQCDINQAMAVLIPSGEFKAFLFELQ